jgi:hypothetical protein
MLSPENPIASYLAKGSKAGQAGGKKIDEGRFEARFTLPSWNFHGFRVRFGCFDEKEGAVAAAQQVPLDHTIGSENSIDFKVSKDHHI